MDVAGASLGRTARQQAESRLAGEWEAHTPHRMQLTAALMDQHCLSCFFLVASPVRHLVEHLQRIVQVGMGVGGRDADPHACGE